MTDSCGQTLPILRVVVAILSLGGFSGSANAAVFGEDDRQRPEALLSAQEVKQYSSIQRIECEAPGDGISGAGTLASDFTHGVTMAHLFYSEKLRRMYAPSECRLRVYDGAGKELQQVRIKRFRTMWDHARRRAGNDLAMFELAEASKHIEHFQSLPVTPAPLSEGESLLVVTFHFDLPPGNTKRKTRGVAYSNIGTVDEGMPNGFHTDADWVPGSSGGPIYDSRGVWVALVQGNINPGGTKAATFDRAQVFNRALRLDARFLWAYAEFVAGR